MAKARQPKVSVISLANSFDVSLCGCSHWLAFRSNDVASARLRQPSSFDPTVASLLRSGFLVVIKIVPLVPAGKYFDMSTAGSSALSKMRSQGSFWFESQRLVRGESHAFKSQQSAMSRNPESALFSVLASM